MWRFFLKKKFSFICYVKVVSRIIILLGHLNTSEGIPFSASEFPVFSYVCVCMCIYKRKIKSIGSVQVAELNQTE